MRRNTVHQLTAMPEKKGHGWLPNGEIFRMDEAFPDEIEKMCQEANDDNEDYVIGSNVECDDGDGF